MRYLQKLPHIVLVSMLLIVAIFMTGCGGGGSSTTTSSITVLYTTPDINATDVPLNRNINAVLSVALDPLSVNTTTFTLKKGPTQSSGTTVSGTVSYVNSTMIFKPDANLDSNSTYTATISTGVQNATGTASLATEYVWSFKTGTTIALGPDPVNLGTAGMYTVLAKTAIITAGNTTITGDVGISPAALSDMLGFNVTLDASGTYATSALVTGNIYASDMTPPTPSILSTAVNNMENSYIDAAGRTVPAPQVLAADITGLTITPGLYNAGSDVVINSGGVTLNGGANDVWIFQIGGNLTVGNGAIITLSGGAQAKNIFWQVAGGIGVSIGTTAQFKGVILAQQAVTANTGAIINSRLLVQSAVALNDNNVTAP
ncbi:MAG: ice-binding family protein [Sulfurospirillaceae bacterium]|nr:ice-binding family protein [Sulfurospirillaceae bacterium]